MHVCSPDDSGFAIHLPCQSGNSTWPGLFLLHPQERELPRGWIFESLSRTVKGYLACHYGLNFHDLPLLGLGQGPSEHERSVHVAECMRYVLRLLMNSFHHAMHKSRGLPWRRSCMAQTAHADLDAIGVTKHDGAFADLELYSWS